MTKLDLVIERIRKLNPEQQEAVAEEIDFIVDDVEHSGSVLTDEQWRQVKAALADPNEPTSTHEDVFARLEADEK